MRQVEDWMLDVESSMMKSIHANFSEAVKSYKKMERTKWISVPPGQCVLNGS